jgi:hypothetical protein
MMTEANDKDTVADSNKQLLADSLQRAHDALNYSDVREFVIFTVRNSGSMTFERCASPSTMAMASVALAKHAAGYLP